MPRTVIGRPIGANDINVPWVYIGRSLFLIEFTTNHQYAKVSGNMHIQLHLEINTVLMCQGSSA